MSKPENTFVASIHRHLLPGRKDPYWMKNNNQYTSGIWDVWYSGPRGDLWVEYKWLDRIPMKAPFAPALSELQKQWGGERYAEGRNLAVIVGCKEGGVVFEATQWENEITNAAFKGRILTRQQLAAWLIERTCG